MENVNVSMITKKKNDFTHLNLAGEKKKNPSKNCETVGNQSLEASGFPRLLLCSPKCARFKLSPLESQSKAQDDFSN